MRLLYNLLFPLAFLAMAPYYFWRLWRRGNWVQGFAQRFGTFDKNIRQAVTNRDVIWIHAVSVGEANVCVELVRALEARLPNAKLVVSTTTTTGMAELRKRLPGHVGKIYYPIDRKKYVRWALSAMHPSAIILVETEIWPNFLWRAGELRVPVFLVNARLSRKSLPRYRALRSFFGPLFATLSGVGAQTEEYARQFIQLGCQPEAVRVTGSMKFEAAKLDATKSLDVAGLLRRVGVPSDALILLGGSTHQGEERMLAEQYLRLRRTFPNLFLVLVPRHFERSSDIGRDLKRHLKLYYRSEIEPGTAMAPGSIDALLVDTTGELMSFYREATVVFVGKSMMAQGGQNPIEPAALGKVVVFGPNMQNFADISRLLVDEGGALQVQSPAEMETVLADLLTNHDRRTALGDAARQVVEKNRGAVERTLDMIIPHMADRGLYVAPQQASAARKPGVLGPQHTLV